jgi:hypothetical protein
MAQQSNVVYYPKLDGLAEGLEGLEKGLVDLQSGLQAANQCVVAQVTSNVEVNAKVRALPCPLLQLDQRCFPGLFEFDLWSAPLMF